MKIKFKFLSYLQGYGSWNAEVYEGSIDQAEGYYIIRVLKGKHYGTNGEPIENKSFRVPINCTIIEENI